MDANVKIFNETPDFLTAIKQLNDEDEETCACEFRKLALNMAEHGLNMSKLHCNQVDGKYGLVYGVILDRVAYFPLKPVVMQEELVRLGLNETLSQRLAGIWADNAKRIVLARKKVETDLKEVEFEVLKNLQSEEETVNLHLTHSDGHKTVLNFKIGQLFAFYKQIEDIQSNIDLICK